MKFGTNLGLKGGKYLIKIIFDIKIEIDIFVYLNIKCAKFEQILSIFNFGAKLGLTGGKYFIKINFDFKIEIDILEILDVPNFNEFSAFLILGQFWT